MTIFLADVAFWWRSPDCVNVFNRGVFHHPVWFVSFVGVFSVTLSCLIFLASLGNLHHWRAWRPLSIRSASSGALAWSVRVDTGSLGRCSSLGEFHGVLNHSIPSIFIQKGCFSHTLSHIAAWETDWPSIGASWTWKAWSSRHRDYFWLSDRIGRLTVLYNSCPSYLQWAAGAGPVVAQCLRSRRDKVLVLAIIIHHPY